ncbi:conserved Plasmodium protein, unknown function [Plasmodium relictum]|uniref:Uncharacterized protein n=1 Tax=Plasmodium relictum TaxID=85471 RepID=A0A1J1H1M2_PLARL|nr:conserved Plasmodium protein, unknown function [Plasmodium relictum]CRG98470.1 conserved Plasmodium protein, unknown function [Plasmodium relictum]
MEKYKSIKEIRDGIKEMELECRKLKKDIKKKEKDRKLFKISTVVLKKYNSYLYNNLNNFSNNHFNYIFMYSCGILFTNTTFENDNKGHSNNLINSNISNFFRHEENEKINKSNISLVNIIKQKKLFHKNKHLEKKKHEKYKEHSELSSKKKGVNNMNNIYYNFSLKNYEKSIESVKSEVMKSEVKNTFFNIKEKDNLLNIIILDKKEREIEEYDNEQDKNVNCLKEQMFKKNYEQIKKKKKKKSFITTLNSNFYNDSKKKKSYYNFHFDREYNKKEEKNLNSDGLNSASNIINSILSHKDNFSNLNKNCIYNFSHMNNIYDEKKIRDDKDYKLKYSSNELLKDKSSYCSLYRNKKYYEKKRTNNRSHIDSYIDLIKNDKVFSFFENKKKTKNTFIGFMNQIKNIFFLNENKDNCIKEIKEKKEEFNILKYQCLIKSKKVEIYLCVCPNCLKNFYLLIKKSSNKKLKSKVFHPSHFSSLVSDLKKQKAHFLSEQNIQKYENFSDKKNFCLDINSVEYFYETKIFNENENKFDYCSCYIKMEKNNFFDNLDILLYI